MDGGSAAVHAASAPRLGVCCATVHCGDAISKGLVLWLSLAAVVGVDPVMDILTVCLEPHTQMMAALSPADEVMTDASTDRMGSWTPVSEPVSVKPSVDMAVLVRVWSWSGSGFVPKIVFRLELGLRLALELVCGGPECTINFVPVNFNTPRRTQGSLHARKPVKKHGIHQYSSWWCRRRSGRQRSLGKKLCALHIVHRGGILGLLKLQMQARRRLCAACWIPRLEQTMTPIMCTQTPQLCHVCSQAHALKLDEVQRRALAGLRRLFLRNLGILVARRQKISAMLQVHLLGNCLSQRDVSADSQYP